MELKDLQGCHKLSGVDYVTSEKERTWFDNYGNDIVICIDGTNYVLTENEDDGYRSFMEEILITDRTIRNKFPDQDVRIEYVENDENNVDEDDLIRIYSMKTGKLIIEVGTRNVTDYYPCAVFSFYPENLDINNADEP